MGSRIGERLGAYVATDHLADGAMSSVYEAHHQDSHARVAIKVLRPEMACDAVAVERFRREYETTKALRHPHIVHVIDFGRAADGCPFIVMELLRGEPLGSALARQGALCPARAVPIVCQLSLGLWRAHSDGVVHRDLKPENIFLCDADGGPQARILDFGSVKLQLSIGPRLTTFGMTLGSPCYMSPEQALGRPDIDPRSDLFSFATIIHEMATGQVAFAGDDVAEIIAEIMESEPPSISGLNPDYPPQLDEVVRRGLRKDKTERYSSAIQLGEAFVAALGLSPRLEAWSRATPDEVERALLEETTVSPGSARGHLGLRKPGVDELGSGPQTVIPPK